MDRAETFDLEAAKKLLGEVFAPWIQDLKLEVMSVARDEVVLRMPFSNRLTRSGGIICGQALMALADTAMVFAVAAASGRSRPMTTVDQTTHFLRPVSDSAVLCAVRITRLGRTMAFAQATISTESDGKPVATAQLAYALLEG